MEKNNSLLAIEKKLSTIVQAQEKLAQDTATLSNKLANYIEHQDHVQATIASSLDKASVDPLIFSITIFVLSCIIGYYVVWRVTPALHTPLMSVTNAISGIIVVGAILSVGQNIIDISKIFGFLAVFLASINIFGGFLVTQRMLDMFRKK